MSKKSGHLKRQTKTPSAGGELYHADMLVVLLEIISCRGCCKTLCYCRLGSKSHIKYCTDGTLPKGRRQIGALDPTLHSVAEVVVAHPGP